MRIGIFADTHDHLDNIRTLVAQFNAAQCAYAVCAGDLVSTFALPPLRRLNCPLIACFGDNEGNKLGLQAGLRRGDVLGEPPFVFRVPDGTRILLAHMKRQVRGAEGEFDVCVYAHTHKPRVERDECDRLWLNPGEASGWTYGQPTVAMLETLTRTVEILALR